MAADKRAPRSRHGRTRLLATLGLALTLLLSAGGCASSAKKDAAQKGFMAGQQQAWSNMQIANPNSIRVIGPVNNPLVEWVEDLTVAGVLVAAEYLAPGDPKEIRVVRAGRVIWMISGQGLLRGQDMPALPGDIIEVRP